LRHPVSSDLLTDITLGDIFLKPRENPLKKSGAFLSKA
jgi:hypothetical protein